MSNSNFNITKVVVDPTSQEITNLEINGKAFESGSEANLEERVYDADNKLNVGNIFGEKATEVEIYPSSGYDGLERVTIGPDGITGYPEYDFVEIAKFTGDEAEDPSTAWFAFKADVSGEAEHLSDYIITGTDAKVWKKEDNSNGGGFVGSLITEYTGLTRGSTYVSITVDGKVYKSDNLDDFLLVYLNQSN